MSNPCDWPEDFAHENGRYENACLSCGRTFIGHKRRYACRQCVVTTIDMTRGVPAYHPTEAQPIRVGGSET